MEEEASQIWQRFVLEPREMDQWTWGYGKGQYYNERYDDDHDLVTIDKSSYGGESEAESHNDSIPYEMFLGKEKKI